eukprot:947547_1
MTSDASSNPPGLPVSKPKFSFKLSRASGLSKTEESKRKSALAQKRADIDDQERKWVEIEKRRAKLQEKALVQKLGFHEDDTDAVLSGKLKLPPMIQTNTLKLVPRVLKKSGKHSKKKKKRKSETEEDGESITIKQESIEGEDSYQMSAVEIPAPEKSTDANSAGENSADENSADNISADEISADDMSADEISTDEGDLQEGEIPEESLDESFSSTRAERRSSSSSGPHHRHRHTSQREREMGALKRAEQYQKDKFESAAAEAIRRMDELKRRAKKLKRKVKRLRKQERSLKDLDLKHELRAKRQRAERRDDGRHRHDHAALRGMIKNERIHGDRKKRKWDGNDMRSRSVSPNHHTTHKRYRTDFNSRPERPYRISKFSSAPQPPRREGHTDANMDRRYALKFRHPELEHYESDRETDRGRYASDRRRSSGRYSRDHDYRRSRESERSRSPVSKPAKELLKFERMLSGSSSKKSEASKSEKSSETSEKPISSQSKSSKISDKSSPNSTSHSKKHSKSKKSTSKSKKSSSKSKKQSSKPKKSSSNSKKTSEKSDKQSKTSRKSSHKLNKSSKASKKSSKSSKSHSKSRSKKRKSSSSKRKPKSDELPKPPPALERVENEENVLSSQNPSKPDDQSERITSTEPDISVECSENVPGTAEIPKNVEISQNSEPDQDTASIHVDVSDGCDTPEWSRRSVDSSPKSLLYVVRRNENGGKSVLIDLTCETTEHISLVDDVENYEPDLTIPSSPCRPISGPKSDSRASPVSVCSGHAPDSPTVLNHASSSPSLSVMAQRLEAARRRALEALHNFSMSPQKQCVTIENEPEASTSSRGQEPSAISGLPRNSENSESDIESDPKSSTDHLQCSISVTESSVKHSSNREERPYCSSVDGNEESKSVIATEECDGIEVETSISKYLSPTSENCAQSNGVIHEISRISYTDTPDGGNSIQSSTNTIGKKYHKCSAESSSLLADEKFEQPADENIVQPANENIEQPADEKFDEIVNASSKCD